jgi:hypothetical protein
VDELLREQVQWDVAVAVVRRGDELLFTPYAAGPDR